MAALCPVGYSDVTYARFPRVIGQKYIMSYIDEQIALYDCVQRYRFYDYVAVIDVDEIIMPYISYTQAKDINYKIMMRRLLEKYPNAAGFTMMTSTFVLDWKPTHPQADYMIGQYTRALIPIFSLSSKTVLLFHYRHCRTGKGSDKSCLTDEKRSTVVNTMKIFISTIRQRLDSNRRLIFN
ncbi:hypothetical protein MAR_015981 [Mya arenaria]|uniref:Glycosyltransferase family 92 protein n=1 Tax=Mya arenaria TaxID=6604 RepID=A0ABY7FK99_MYAAR|nr:hypothetical protein MAR_015981 [Mya arenaria]